MVIFEKVRTAQDRLSEKFQALYASAMYKNEPLALSLEILHLEMDLFHKIYQNIIKDSYVPFIIASLTRLRICHMVYMETFKCLKIQKGQIISAKPLKIG